MDVQGLLVPGSILGQASLIPTARLVLALMTELARSGGLVFISRSAVARRLSISTRAVQCSLRTLERSGWLLREVSQAGRGAPCGWRLLRTAPRLADLRPLRTDLPQGRTPRRLAQLTLFEEMCLDPIRNDLGKASR
jgi:hypothetical protein